MAYLLLRGSSCGLLGQEALRSSKAVPRGELREGPVGLRRVPRCFWRPPVPLAVADNPQTLATVHDLMLHCLCFPVSSSLAYWSNFFALIYFTH